MWEKTLVWTQAVWRQASLLAAPYSFGIGNGVRMSVFSAVWGWEGLLQTALR